MSIKLVTQPIYWVELLLYSTSYKGSIHIFFFCLNNSNNSIYAHSIHGRYRLPLDESEPWDWTQSRGSFVALGEESVGITVYGHCIGEDRKNDHDDR